MSLIGVVSISLTASLFFLLQKNMAWIGHAVSRLAALRRVYGLQRLCPRVLSNQRHSHLFYLLVLFSTPLFYPQVPSMDRCRIRSVLSPDDCS